MNVGSRRIKQDSPVYIIAELGVNHDGQTDLALNMIDAAASAGADAIKLQFFRAELLMSAAARPATYQSAAGEHDPMAMLRRLELSTHDLTRICHRAHERGMNAIVTVFSAELVDEAQHLPADAFKTASPDIVHRPLLEKLTATGSPMIVSTGAATMTEVQRAVEWISSAHDRIALLQCVSAYPTSVEHASLDGIAALQHAFPDVPIGYSDHTTSEKTGAHAVEHGAVILEKHLTWNRSAHGPDHAASLDPIDFAHYVQRARAAKKLHPARLGQKRVLAIEQDVRTASRQSVVTTRSIRAGERLGQDCITFKRPGTGFEPWQMDRVVGRIATRDIAEDVPIMPGDLG